jgi:predicted PurR-regulated permease PerM
MDRMSDSGSDDLGSNPGGVTIQNQSAMQQPYSFIAKATYLLLFVTLFIVILVYAKDFFVPIAFGLLLSSLLSPLCKWLCHTGVPKGLSILISILLMMVFFGGISIFFVNEIGSLSEDFPELKEKAIENINDVSHYVEDNFGVSISMQKNWAKEQINNLFSSGNKLINTIFNATTGTLFKVLIMPVFMFYILFYQDRFSEFILRLAGEKRKKTAKKILRDVSFVSQRYFGGAFIVVLILSVLNSLALHILGLKYPILFGVISAFFNFIPYFGTWIGAFFPFTFALLTGDSLNLAFGVIIVFMIIQFIENNILTPHITGGYVRLNPFITILALIAGSMVWGIAGMLLVIPFLASLKIVFENFKSTSVLSYLIARPTEEPKSKFRRKIRAYFSKKKDKPGSPVDSKDNNTD